MARTSDVKRFDSDSYEATVRHMRTRREDVYETGRRHKQETGAIHPYVDVRQNRGSHNAMTRGEIEGTIDPWKNGSVRL